MQEIFVTFWPYFCVLGLSAIALIFSERAGIINIGINGVMVMGSTFYMIFANLFTNAGITNPWMQIPLFAISVIGGILTCLLFGYAVIKLKANQIITGVALNILAPAITIVILILFGQAERLPFNVGELALGNAANNDPANVVSLKVILTLFIISASAVLLKYTRWGLRFKAVGENPQAADVAGINVNRVKWSSIIISGAIAGLAGGIYIASLSSGNIFRGNNEGLGFLAIAIMIVGQWKVMPSIIASAVFSLLFAFGYQFKAIFPEQQDAVVAMIKAIPYILTVVTLIIFSKRSAIFLSRAFSRISIQSGGPKAAGEPYDKSKR